MTNVYISNIGRKRIQVHIVDEKAPKTQVRAIPVDIKSAIEFVKKTKRYNVYRSDLQFPSKNLHIWILGASNINEARIALNEVIRTNKIIPFKELTVANGMKISQSVFKL